MLLQVVDEGGREYDVSFNVDDDGAMKLKCDLIEVNCGVIVVEGGDADGVDGDTGCRFFLCKERVPRRCLNIDLLL